MEWLVEYVQRPQFWTGLFQIVVIDILLAGDNAVVIALAVRSLPARQRRWGIILGAGAAIGLRVVFAAVVVYLLEVPYLKLVGGALLLWIAVKLMVPEESHRDGDDDGVAAADNLWRAVRIIVIADVVMSFDNVVAIGAAAQGSVTLLVLGLLISVPLIFYGSTLILKLVDRYPVIVAGGAALLGWVAGQIMVSDPAIVSRFGTQPAWVDYGLRVAMAVLVLVVGSAMARRARARRAAPRMVVDLAKENENAR